MWFTALIPIFSTLIDRVFPSAADKQKADEAKIAMEKALAEAAAQEMESKSKVIVAEAQSQSYAARNWRPHLMYGIMLIIIYNYMAAPIMKSMGLDLSIVPIPGDMWTLLTIGLGGYIGKDMVHNYASAKFDNKKFYDVLRAQTGGLDQKTVDKLNKALEEASK